ncbi:Uncharacterized protein DAT39_020898, partial [Clarias magur]
TMIIILLLPASGRHTEHDASGYGATIALLALLLLPQRWTHSSTTCYNYVPPDAAILFGAVVSADA